jgi:hypothetical protein
VLLAIVGNGVATSAQATSAPEPSQHIAVPSYFYPGSDWARLDQSVPPVRLAIINPNSGPGDPSLPADPNYQHQVAITQAAGVAVLGYVPTWYAGTLSPPAGTSFTGSLADVEKEVDLYFTRYQVHGIFFDQGAATCPQAAAYYAPLRRYVHQKWAGVVVVNPGTQTPECFMNATDVLVNFEGFYSTYSSASYTQPSWILRYPSTRFWHIIHDAGQISDLQNAVRLSKQRHAGWVYVTDLGEPNPYGALPAGPYWTAELGAVGASH